jgi:autotransporter-associated beta strand protein
MKANPIARGLRFKVSVVGCALILVSGLSSAQAATRTWSGLSVTTDLWSDTANWSNGTVPGAGDDVVFPTVAPRRTPNNNLLTSLRSITFGDGGYSIIGNNLTLTNGINATNITEVNSFTPLIALGASQSFTNLTPGTELDLVTLDLHGRSASFGGAGTNDIGNLLEDTVGGGSLTNNGTGVFLFAGTNLNFTGSMALNGGTNIFTGDQERSPITWTAGTLGGTGTLGNVTASSAGAKQLVAGYLSPGNLTISNLVLNPSVTVSFQINGTNFQTDYSHVDIGIGTGFSGADLGSATLSVSFVPNFSPPVGTLFPLFLTVPHATVIGSFTNMPEGSTITNNNVVYQLSYNFGHGVLLTVVTVPSTGVTRTWSGNGANTFWSNPANWSGGVAPQQGDELVFARLGASLIVNSNDFPAQTTFDSIHFQTPQATGAGWTLLGNPFRLNAGVFVEPTLGNATTGNGTYTISNQIILNNLQAFTNALTGLNASLHLAGGVDLGTNTLSVGAQTTFGEVFQAPVTGSGLLEMDGGAGTVVLDASNAISGVIQVNKGTLTVQHPQGLGSVTAGPVQIGTNGVLNLNPTNPASFTGSLITVAGTLASDATVVDVSLAVPILASGSNGIVSVPQTTSRTLTLSGPVTNSTQLTLSQHSGLGTANVPAGAVILGGGILRVTNDTPSGGVALNADGAIHNTILANAGTEIVTLGGAGQIDSLICTNCDLEPGSIFDSSLAYNPLNVGMLLMASAQGRFPGLSVNLFPNRPGGGPTNNAIIVTNPPTLGSAALFLVAKTNLTPNQQFTIIRNLSSAPVTNTFLNLPEGSLVLPQNGSLSVRISYVGGAGHDVVLTVQSNQPPVLAVPTNTVFFNQFTNNAYTNVISDVEQSAETFTWTNLTVLPTGLTLNAVNGTNGVLSWTPNTNQAPSTNVVVFKVTDSGTPPLSATGQVTIIVRAVNQAPVPVQIQPNPTNVVAGHTLTIQLQANDPDNPPDAPIWGATSLPTGASITTGGLFSYTPPGNDSGTKSCTVFVYDFNANDVNPTSPTNSLTFSVQVARSSIVVNTNDSDVGSLRWAITNIASDGGRIEFNIPGSGPQKIAPLTALPPIGANTIIDGYTQPGAQPNTNAIGTGAKIMIELSGENLPGFPNGLNPLSGCTIRGLCINKFAGFAVTAGNCCCGGCGASGIVVEGCFIGTDTTGTNARPNSTGINFGCACGSRIGGSDPSQRNLISGNTANALNVGGFGETSMIVQNNLIGTDRTGTNALGNGNIGLNLNGSTGSSGCLVADNVFGANALNGINDAQPSDVIVRNKIGVGADGTTAMGNGSDGLSLNNSGVLVGGTNGADANIVAYNNGFGVSINGQHTTNVSVLGNSIFRNTGRAIHLDPLGANNNQSAPVVTGVTGGAGITTVSGTLNSQSNTAYRVELFHNPDFNPNGQPQAWVFLGSTNVTTSSSSNARFSITFNQSVTSGFITATATDPTGNTSGISDGLAFSAPVLNIARVSGQARVFWLTNVGAFILQTNGDIVLHNGWGDVPGANGTSGSNFFRDFPPTNATKFFRLRSQ